MYKNHKEQGFTIVELLVVVAIMTIFPLIVISNFPAIRMQFSLSRAAYAFAQDVRNTQDLALSSISFRDNFGIEQVISGYGLFLDTNSLGATTYLIYADKYPGNHEYDQEDYIVKTVDISIDAPGIIISQLVNTSANSVSIDFYPPNPTTQITGLSGQEGVVDIVFSFEDDAQTQKTVSINSSGLIDVQ